ncbi:Hypothetical protein CBG15913, partial [Paramuricea clavata]
MTKAEDLLSEEFKKRFGKYPEVAQFDEGNEFYNVGVKNLLQKHDVRYFSTNSDRKAAILIKKFNRTLKTTMWKVDDAVRITKYKSIFKSHDGQPIGKFYEKELSVVDKKDDVYREEKILRRRKERENDILHSQRIRPAVEEQLEQQYLDAPQELVDDVLANINERMDDELPNQSEAISNSVVITENELRGILKAKENSGQTSSINLLPIQRIRKKKKKKSPHP